MSGLSRGRHSWATRGVRRPASFDGTQTVVVATAAIVDIVITSTAICGRSHTPGIPRVQLRLLQHSVLGGGLASTLGATSLERLAGIEVFAAEQLLKQVLQVVPECGDLVDDGKPTRVQLPIQVCVDDDFAVASAKQVVDVLLNERAVDTGLDSLSQHPVHRARPQLLRELLNLLRVQVRSTRALAVHEHAYGGVLLGNRARVRLSDQHMGGLDPGHWLLFPGCGLARVRCWGRC